MQHISVFDCCFFAAIIISLIVGFMRGFVRQLLGLVGILAGIYCAYRISEDLTEWWHGHFDVDIKTMKIVVFLIILALVYLLVLWLAVLLGRLLKMAMLGWVNRLFGMLFGAIKTVIIFCALAYSIHYLKLAGVEIKDIEKSVTFDCLITVVDSIFNRF
jgi:membrane protein required for colicin V production